MTSHQKTTSLIKAIESTSVTLSDPADREVTVLKEHDAVVLSQQYDVHVSDIYIEALKKGVCPYRYLRNRTSLSVQDQLTLAQSKIAVVGAGGLGGSVILMLARLGLGHLVVIDYDVFDETNLNRQAISSTAGIGVSKCEEAKRLVQTINPAVVVTPHSKKLEPAAAVKYLKGCHVVVDALDNIRDRFLLETAAKPLTIPMVHGAVGGFTGQVMTIFPEDTGLEAVYGKDPGRLKDAERPEALMGVPAVTPSLVAGYQVMEVVKILLGKEDVLRNCLLYIDVESGQLERLHFNAG